MQNYEDGTPVPQLIDCPDANTTVVREESFFRPAGCARMNAVMAARMGRQTVTPGDDRQRRCVLNSPKKN
jgi:hypothetical protein